LKQENRELKYKLDNLEGNMPDYRNDQNNPDNASYKKSKDERESANLNMKY
jgi:hypothetical protein